MKKKIILSSILTIALCLSLIAGSTYALFTSESSVNITATAGKVKVTAKLDTLQVYSLGVEQSVNTDDKTFENGGTAELTAGKLTLTNITPGDKATLNITLKNNSNVNIQYRVKWTVNGNLANGLVATADGVDLADAAWTEWNIPTSDAEKVKVIPVSVELPVEAGNEYQKAEADILFTVEAVQGNAVTPVSNYDELEAALANAQPGEIIELAAGDFGAVTLDGELEGVTFTFDEDTDVRFSIGEDAELKDVVFDGLYSDYVDNESAYVDGGAINIDAGASVQNLVLQNCVLKATGSRSCAIGVSEPTAEITLRNCEVAGSKYVVYGSAPIAKLTLNECQFANISSWVAMLNAGDGVGAQLTIDGCTFENCNGGIVKYLGSTQPDGAFTVFTNNTLTNCQGHDGYDAQWFAIPGATSTITVSGNTLDGATWTPGTAQSLGK